MRVGYGLSAVPIESSHSRFYQRYRCDYFFLLTGLQPEVQNLLERTGLLDKIGKENCFETTDAAVCALTPTAISCPISPPSVPVPE